MHERIREPLLRADKVNRLHHGHSQDGPARGYTYAEGLTCVTRKKRGAEKGARTRAVVSAGARARAFIRDTVEKFKNKKIGVLLMLHPVSKITIFSIVSVFTSKISLSKLHYSPITSNLLPHVWSIKCR